MLKSVGRSPVSPFVEAADADAFLAAATHREALARLAFLVQHRQSLGILSGGQGSGKSLTLARFARDCRDRGCSVGSVNLLGVEMREFLWQLAAALHAHPGDEDEAFTLARKVEERIRANHFQRLTTVLLLDDADEASHDVLLQTLRLIKTQAGGLTTILAVEPSRLTRLGGDLLQIAQLRIHLEPWEESDVREYLETSLARTGNRAAGFSDAAVRRVQELTDGIPRWVRQLAELAWLAAASQDLETIEPETVEAAYRELSAAYLEQPAAF